MHPVQKILLQRLLLKNSLKYSELTFGYDADSNVVFHLKQLLNKGYIEKKNDIYSLTAGGLKEAKNEETGVKMFFLGFLCENNGKFLIREHSEGKTKFCNLPSGKPHFGEKIEQSLTRTFFDIARIKLKPDSFEYLSLHLKTVKSSSDDILFDDAFAIYRVTISDDQIGKMNLKKGVVWLTAEEIKKCPNRWPEIDLCILERNFAPYLVYQFTSNHILN